MVGFVQREAAADTWVTSLARPPAGERGKLTPACSCNNSFGDEFAQFGFCRRREAHYRTLLPVPAGRLFKSPRQSLVARSDFAHFLSSVRVLHGFGFSQNLSGARSEVAREQQQRIDFKHWAAPRQP